MLLRLLGRLRSVYRCMLLRLVLSLWYFYFNLFWWWACRGPLSWKTLHAAGYLFWYPLLAPLLYFRSSLEFQEKIFRRQPAYLIYANSKLRQFGICLHFSQSMGKPTYDSPLAAAIINIGRVGRACDGYRHPEPFCLFLPASSSPSDSHSFFSSHLFVMTSCQILLNDTCGCILEAVVSSGSTAFRLSSWTVSRPFPWTSICLGDTPIGHVCLL